MQPSTYKYTTFAMLFHWFIAVAVVLTIALALYLDGLDLGPAKSQALSIHKSVGIAIFVFTWLRLVWRLNVDNSIQDDVTLVKG